ncbi:MAG: hypothetical protein IKU03_04245 [Bacteroidales bacterium]|nr:hypothetical protein [Bacteroidales bacterium]
MTNDFDQLIQQKLDDTHYAYKASAWRKFRRFAGLKNLAPWICTIGSVSVVGVGVLLWTLLHTPKTVEPASTPEVMLVAEDTASLAEESEAPVAEMTSSEPRVPVAVAQSHSHAAGEVETPEADPKPAPVPEAKKTSAPVYGIPVVIDVDTITQMWPTDEQLKEGNSRLY